MLYDNALLAMAYLAAYEETGKELYRTVAQKVFSYMERELAHPGGGFYSAQDADSEGVEGKYYLLTKDELLALLGRRTAAVLPAFRHNGAWELCGKKPPE
jgi:uncharacterized protein YyaL (SSP411 family)